MMFLIENAIINSLSCYVEIHSCEVIPSPFILQRCNNCACEYCRVAWRDSEPIVVINDSFINRW